MRGGSVGLPGAVCPHPARSLLSEEQQRSQKSSASFTGGRQLDKVTCVVRCSVVPNCTPSFGTSVCIPLHCVRLWCSTGMSPTLGPQPLWDVSRPMMTPTPGCHHCRLPGGSPPAPLQQQNFCLMVHSGAAADFPLCARCMGAQRPAGVVSCLLHYSSLAQRLGHAAVGCWGPAGCPGLSPHRGGQCSWLEAAAEKQSGFAGSQRWGSAGRCER